MSNAFAIYQKELWHYFRSPIAYFVVAVFLLGAGYFFSYNIFFTGIASMAESGLLMDRPLLGLQGAAVSLRDTSESDHTEVNHVLTCSAGQKMGTP